MIQEQLLQLKTIIVLTLTIFFTEILLAQDLIINLREDNPNIVNATNFSKSNIISVRVTSGTEVILAQDVNIRLLDTVKGSLNDRKSGTVKYKDKKLESRIILRPELLQNQVKLKIVKQQYDKSNNQESYTSTVVVPLKQWVQILQHEVLDNKVVASTAKNLQPSLWVYIDLVVLLDN